MINAIECLAKIEINYINTSSPLIILVNKSEQDLSGNSGMVVAIVYPRTMELMALLYTVEIIATFQSKFLYLFVVNYKE